MGIGCDEKPDFYRDQSSGENEPCDLALKIIYCSICLEIVAPSHDRGSANLICGHKFHLDCIGSAFNVKGAMECPNCRRVENGRWLYSNGSRPCRRTNVNRDEDLYELRALTEASFGVQWCPYPNSTRAHPPYEERGYPMSPFQEAASSTSHRCPYVAYYGPIYHQSSSPSSSSFNTHWSGPRIPIQNPNSPAFNAIDLRYRNWESASHRYVRSPSEISRPGQFPFVSPSASGSILGSISPYQDSNVRTRDRADALQAYYQQLPVESSSDRNGLFYVPRRGYPESENVSLRVRYGETLCLGEREMTQSLATRSDTGNGRSSVRMRQGTESLFRS